MSPRTIVASAPAKVILLGGKGVNWGFPALVAAVGMRTTCTLRAAQRPGLRLCLRGCRGDRGRKLARRFQEEGGRASRREKLRGHHCPGPWGLLCADAPRPGPRRGAHRRARVRGLLGVRGPCRVRPRVRSRGRGIPGCGRIPRRGRNPRAPGAGLGGMAGRRDCARRHGNRPGHQRQRAGWHRALQLGRRPAARGHESDAAPGGGRHPVAGKHGQQQYRLPHLAGGAPDALPPAARDGHAGGAGPGGFGGGRSAAARPPDEPQPADQGEAGDVGAHDRDAGGSIPGRRRAGSQDLGEGQRRHHRGPCPAGKRTGYRPGHRGCRRQGHCASDRRSRGDDRKRFPRITGAEQKSGQSTARRRMEWTSPRWSRREGSST